MGLKTRRPTRKRIEEAIKNGHHAMVSIAVYLGVTTRTLIMALDEQHITWLVPRDAVDRYAIQYHLDRGVTDPTKISAALKNTYCYVPVGKIRQMIEKHNLEPCEVKAERLKADVTWPARIHMGWKEFGRKTNERRKYEALRAA